MLCVYGVVASGSDLILHAFHFPFLAATIGQYTIRVVVFSIAGLNPSMDFLSSSDHQEIHVCVVWLRLGGN